MGMVGRLYVVETSASRCGKRLGPPAVSAAGGGVTTPGDGGGWGERELSRRIERARLFIPPGMVPAVLSLAQSLSL